ncbi:MAG: efflux RND transporter periplasmic adaptor subunit [Syntrophothermus sp.]|uniref:efflux RND transporter periplasmic adaptor subunit n=1 Tax=Syntrophothermus sp. TaxID=2736299 RepID=UPI00257FBDF9|nr:efflux RND transporter periplasmic adaptor subunit [Syntrophothermus sp.]NSW83030.1 efflux RND transporter periplasmic adaptor subunit [Syntrophothermus sp.]
MSKTRWLLIGSGALLMVAVVVAAVYRGYGASAVEVKTGVAVRRVYEDKVLATGKVETVNPAEVVTPYAARLVSLRVKEGDRVTAGQSLGELDLTDSEQNLKDAEAAYNIARVELEQAYDEAKPERLAEAESALQASRVAAEAARKKLERYKYLLEQGAVSQAEYEEVEAAYTRAQAEEEAAAARLQALREDSADRIEIQQARLQQAQIALEKARQMVDKGRLPAPIDGVVLQISSDVGSYLQPGVPVLTVGNPDALEVVAEVSEQDIGGIAPGQDVDLNWAGAPGKTFKGKVSRVSPAVVRSGARESENVVKVYIEILQGRQELKPGATVDAVIYRVKPHHTVLVPNEAVVGKGPNRTVFVIEDGRARRRAVTVGYSNELYTEIRSGIEPGQRLILNPKGIRDGQPVREIGGGAK